MKAVSDFASKHRLPPSPDPHLAASSCAASRASRMSRTCVAVTLHFACKRGIWPSHAACNLAPASGRLIPPTSRPAASASAMALAPRHGASQSTWGHAGRQLVVAQEGHQRRQGPHPGLTHPLCRGFHIVQAPEEVRTLALEVCHLGWDGDDGQAVVATCSHAERLPQGVTAHLLVSVFQRCVCLGHLVLCIL